MKRLACSVAAALAERGPVQQELHARLAPALAREMAESCRPDARSRGRATPRPPPLRSAWVRSRACDLGPMEGRARVRLWLVRGQGLAEGGLVGIDLERAAEIGRGPSLVA